MPSSLRYYKDIKKRNEYRNRIRKNNYERGRKYSIKKDDTTQSKNIEWFWLIRCQTLNWQNI